MGQVGGMKRLQVVMASNLASELSGAQVVELVMRLGRGGLTIEKAKELMGDDKKMEEFVKNGLKKDPYLAIPAAGAYARYAARAEGRELIEVPDLSASELTALAKKQLDVDRGDDALDKWDFIRDESGKTYEVLVWKSDCEVTTEEVREHFKAEGADGNTAAFIAWVVKNRPKGKFTSIPLDDFRLFQRVAGLCALRFRWDKRRYFTFGFNVSYPWPVGWSFVAFREIPTD
jgi:hypothetical protein